MSQISIPTDYLIQRQGMQQQDSMPRDVQDMTVRPAAEPALFDQYGTHQSLRQF